MNWENINRYAFEVLGQVRTTPAPEDDPTVRDIRENQRRRNEWANRSIGVEVEE